MFIARILCVLFFSFFVLSGSSQEHFSLQYAQKTKSNVLLTGLTFSTALGGFLAERTVSGYSEEALAGLISPSLGRLDRLSFDWYDLGYKKLSDGLLIESAAIPSLLMLLPKTLGHRKQLLFEWS